MNREFRIQSNRQLTQDVKGRLGTTFFISAKLRRVYANHVDKFCEVKLETAE